MVLSYYTFILDHILPKVHALVYGGGRGGVSVNETLDQSLKCRVLNQLFSSSGLVASTTRFCMSVGRLVSRYVGL